MTKEERQKNSSLYDEYRNIGYMINFLSEIYAVKHFKKSMPFPEFVKIPEKPKRKLFFRKKKDVK